MGYDEIAEKRAKESVVEQSTMMKSPCLRYKGDFMAMMFEKQDCLIIKVPPARVDALIDAGDGREMNFTKKIQGMGPHPAGIRRQVRSVYP